MTAAVIERQGKVLLARFSKGAVFSVGLMLVVIAGAGLLTGDKRSGSCPE